MPSLGGGVVFSIPQFGDFFHDMVCRTRLSAFTGNPGVTPAQGTAAFPLNDVNNGKFYNIVDAFGNRLVAGVPVADPAQTKFTTVSYRNFVRYC